MGGKHQYTAIFAIGAKLLGSFRGAMTAAQARLRGLQAATKRVGGAIKTLTVAFGSLFALFGTFLAANIFKQIFGGASDEARQAQARTRAMLVYLQQMDEIRKKGPAEAQKQLDLIYKHNKALEEQGVLHHSILDTMAVQLTRAHVPVKQTQLLIDKLADVLVVTKDVNATSEDAAALSGAVARAITTGKLLGLQKQGVRITKEQQAAFKQAGNSVERYVLLSKILSENYGDANKKARQTPVGRIQVFQNAIKTMADDIGEQLLPAQAELADSWRAALPEIGPLLITTMKLILRLVTKLGNVVRTQLLPWWHEFQKSERFQQIKDALGWMEKHLKGLAITAGILVAAFAGLSIFSSILPVVIALASPVGLIVAGVLALAAAVLVVWYNWDKIKEMFPATAAVVEHFIEGFKLSFQTGFDFVKAIWKTVYALFTGDFTGVGEAWKKVWNDIVELAKWWEKTLIGIAKAVGQAFKDYFLSVFEDIKKIWTWMKGFSWEGIKKVFSEGQEAGAAYGAQLGPGAAEGGGGAAANAAAVAPTQKAAASVPLSPEGLAKVQAERADLVADLMRPEIRNLVSATLATEASKGEDQKNVLEGMVNRAAAYKRAGTYHGMEAMIKGGFYGPWNRGETSSVMAKGLSDARSEQVKAMIGEIGAGRNVLHGMTDQGMANEIKGYKEHLGEDYYGFMGGLPQQYQTAAYLESHKKAAAGAPPPLLAAQPFATGGIVDKPTLGILGEAGREAVIPLKAGAPRGDTAVHFAPVITVNGNMGEAEQAALDRRLRDLARDFVSSFKRAQTHERRLSYEGGYG